MRYCSLAIVALLLSVPVSAQPIHHHPQKAAYASPAEWPVFSGQAHWPNPDPTMTCHLHVDPKFPYGAELGDASFQVPFTLKLYHCDGRITNFDGEAFESIVWDATGTATRPVMQGDSMGLKQWTGTVTINPKNPSQLRFYHPHGWNGVRFRADVNLSNGDLIEENFWNSFYSVSDLSQPEVLEFGGFDTAMLSSRANFGPACAFETPRPQVTECASFGDMITEVDGWMPLAPIAAPFETALAVYNYTAGSPLPNGRFEQRQDLDLHNGVRGVLVDAGSNDVLGFTNRVVTFDPAVMGPGTHKEAFFWTQLSAQNETASSLIVGDVTVDLSAPPILTCHDQAAPNVGGPLPCLPPVVVPPPPIDICPNIDGVQLTVPIGLLRIDGQCVIAPPPAPVGLLPPGTYTLCNAVNTCSILVIKP